MRTNVAEWTIFTVMLFFLVSPIFLLIQMVQDPWNNFPQTMNNNIAKLSKCLYGDIKISLFLYWHFFCVCLYAWIVCLDELECRDVSSLALMLMHTIWWNDHKISKWKTKKKLEYFYDQRNAYKKHKISKFTRCLTSLCFSITS